MSNKQSQLKKLLIEWNLSVGPYRQIMVEKTRAYIASVSIKQLQNEIETINSQMLLNLMAGASLPLAVRPTWLKQSRKLAGLKQEV